MYHHELASMVGKVNRSFATMLRAMMDSMEADTEEFGIIVQIEKDTDRLATDMENLARYAKTVTPDSKVNTDALSLFDTNMQGEPKLGINVADLLKAHDEDKKS